MFRRLTSTTSFSFVGALRDFIKFPYTVTLFNNHSCMNGKEFSLRLHICCQTDCELSISTFSLITIEKNSIYISTPVATLQTNEFLSKTGGIELCQAIVEIWKTKSTSKLKRYKTHRWIIERIKIDFIDFIFSVDVLCFKQSAIKIKEKHLMRWEKKWFYVLATQLCAFNVCSSLWNLWKWKSKRCSIDMIFLFLPPEQTIAMKKDRQVMNP